MTTKYLSDTWLQCLYSIFRVENDEDLCRTMAHVGLIYTCGVGIYRLINGPSPNGPCQWSEYGPRINGKLGWVLQECMSFLIPVAFIWKTPCLQLRRNVCNFFPFSLFTIHYFYRSFIYPFTTSGVARPVPILTVLNAALFTSYNGFLQGMHLANVEGVQDSLFHLLAGNLLFATGMAINITHDRILDTLKPSRAAIFDENRGTAQRCKIPTGGLFELVSGANYLGEIIEWVGLAVITREYPQAVFALFTGVFLGSRAVRHYKFYRTTFGDRYRQEMKALIPFIL